MRKWNFKGKPETKQDGIISEQYGLLTFEQFYEKYYPVVLGYLRKKTNQKEEAEDLTGKVFLYAYEKWSTYNPQKASLSTWLFVIVHSRWIDYVRTHRPSIPLDEVAGLLPDGDNPMENAIYLESVRQELTCILKRLPEKQRSAIIMRFFGNYEDEEIAAMLDTSEINVRVLIHRGIKTIRTDLSIAEALKEI